MKKNVFLSVLFAVLILGGYSLFAKEEAVVPALPKLMQSNFEGSGLRFKFAVPGGKLTEAQTGKIFTSGNHAADFALPSLKENPVPIRYPRWAVRQGWEGTFVIAAEILTTGEVGRWKVMQSTGYSLLDQAAAGAIRKWRFYPATEGGKSIVSCIQIPVQFTLED